VGSVSFNDLALETAPGEVMTPRTTSERLVRETCSRIHGPARVADVGTGSGAIAVAIAANCPEALVWATDVDARAVALARFNVRRHALEDRVFVRRGDLLEAVPGRLGVIAANLPYLAASAAVVHPDLRGEPFAAVFGVGDGLDAYRRLLTAAATKLTPEGTLVVQFHGRVLVARRGQLRELRRILENHRDERAAA
jgi:release factor glutamine methyltransferase